MSRNTKTILGVIGGIVLLCICGVVAAVMLLRPVTQQFSQNAVAESPEKARAIGSEMLDYQLPTGYRETSGFDFLIGKSVFITQEGDTDGPSPIIMLFQLNSSVGRLGTDEIREQMRRSLEAGMKSQNLQMELADTQTTTIRGGPVNVYTYTGKTDEGVAIHQVVTDLIQGKSGSVMIMITGPETGWEDGLVDEFLEGIE